MADLKQIQSPDLSLCTPHCDWRKNCLGRLSLTFIHIKFDVTSDTSSTRLSKSGS